MIILGMEKYLFMDMAGTSLQGRVIATYDELVELLGEPSVFGGDKTNVEWDLEFRVATDDGEDFDYVRAAIYDWKMNGVPQGEYSWHVGGMDYRSVMCVSQMLEGMRENV